VYVISGACAALAGLLSDGLVLLGVSTFVALAVCGGGDDKSDNRAAEDVPDRSGLAPEAMMPPRGL
jgi:hypothetical protein